MNGKSIVLWVVAIGCIAVGVVNLNRRSAPQSASTVASSIRATASNESAPSMTETSSAFEATPPPATPLTQSPESMQNPVATTPLATVTKPLPAKEVAPSDPVEIVAKSNSSGKELTLPRMALSFVGADPEAEQIWTLAINDPDRPAKERQNLIEDLNEDGFPDPKNVTADDLPLILSRIDLIEHLAPSSMDEVNAAAFGEAYKDLLQMLDRLSR